MGISQSNRRSVQAAMAEVEETTMEVKEATPVKKAAAKKAPAKKAAKKVAK